MLGVVAPMLELHGGLYFLQETNGVGYARVSMLSCAPQLVLSVILMIPSLSHDESAWRGELLTDGFLLRRPPVRAAAVMAV